MSNAEKAQPRTSSGLFEPYSTGWAADLAVERPSPLLDLLHLPRGGPWVRGPTHMSNAEKPQAPTNPAKYRYLRKRCDWCGKWIAINVRAQHMRAKHYPRGKHGAGCVRWDGQLWTCGASCRLNEPRERRT